MIYGLPSSGKTVIKQALFAYKDYPGMVYVNANLRPLELRASRRRRWITIDYQQEYLPIIQAGDFVVTENPYPQAFEFLLKLRNGMLVFAGTDNSYKFIKHFDLVAYLRRGEIVFSGSTQDFWWWVKEYKPEELRDYIPTYLVASGGDPD